MKQITSCGPGLLIGIPTLGRPVPLSWAMKFKALNPPINYNTNYLIVAGKPVAEAREEICQSALDQGHKYVFFLGDDVEPCSLNTLKQMIFRMEQTDSIGVVGAVYCSKSEPTAPLVFKENGRGSYWDWKVGEFFSVTGLGMDCTLIRVDVLAHMSKPWFKTVDEDDFESNVNKADQWTEDLYFCNKLLEETDYEISISFVCGSAGRNGANRFGKPVVCRTRWQTLEFGSTTSPLGYCLSPGWQAESGGRRYGISARRHVQTSPQRAVRDSPCRD